MNYLRTSAMAFALVLVLALAMTACSGLHTKPSPAQGYSFIHKDFDLRYAWKTSQSDQGVRIEGLIKNVRYPRIEQVEINLALLDKSRKVIARGSAFPAPQSISIDDIGSFGVELRNVKVSPGDLLQFQVSYVASAGQNSFSWKTGFTANAITGAVIGVASKSEEESW